MKKINPNYVSPFHFVLTEEVKLEEEVVDVELKTSLDEKTVRINMPELSIESSKRIGLDKIMRDPIEYEISTKE